MALQEVGNQLGLTMGMIANMIATYAVIIGLPAYLILRFLRAYERRGRAPEVDASSATRIVALEAQVERLTNQVERLTEGQQFTTQLLQQSVRPSQSAPTSANTLIATRD